MATLLKLNRLESKADVIEYPASGFVELPRSLGGVGGGGAGRPRVPDTE